MVNQHYILKSFPNKFLLFILLTIYQIQSVTSACNPANCPPLRGLCSNNICVCQNGFVTVNNKYIKNNGIFCNYILKSRFIAFVLEFFFPFGIGHFYAGKTIFASIKLGTFVTLIVCFLIWLCFISKNGTETNLGSIILALIVFLSIIILILMQVFDLIAFGFGIYSDGNGVALS